MPSLLSTSIQHDVQRQNHYMKSSPTPVPGESVVKLDRLQISGKLYGRDQAIRSLMTAFEQVCRGSGIVQLVSGHSGVGKTALVQEVRRPVGRSNGFFLEGKFNQYQQDVPYFAIRQALTGLCRELGRDDDLQRQHWKSGLLQAVGNLGQLLVDLVPELESLLGKQPPVADISPLEARHRFGGVFREFLKVVCRPEHPVVLFIDDWQWADAASLDLLTKLQVDTALRYLLVIVSFRDNEVDSTHPLVVAVEELRRQAVPVAVLEVHNLALSEVRTLLVDALKPEVESSGELAALVHRRTAGNPFYTRALIEFLYHQGLLRFEPTIGRWLWSSSEIRENELPSDVVELFARKLSQLEPACCTLLSRAACLGNRFDLETLAIISDYSTDQCRLMLEAGPTQGLVVPVDDVLASGNFLFLHDRVQQAAYGFIQPAELTEVRLEIGRRLLEHLRPEQLIERIFQVVDHMNAGYSLILDSNEQVRVITLNVQAARKARAATAYRTALQFQRAAARFLELPGFAEQLWENHHELAMQLFLTWAEGEFLEGDRNESERCVRQAVTHAANSVEKAEALNVLIVQFTLLARYPEAIAAGREALEVLGITLPEEDFEAARDIEIKQVRQQLKGRSIAELFDLPVMSNPEMRTAAKLLITMGPPCYRSHQRLWSVIVPKVVNLTIRYGNIPQIGYSHTAFGGLLGWVANDYAAAKEFGELATRLMTSTFDSPSDQSVFYLMIGSSLRHWFEPLKSGSRDYALAYETGLRSGNLQYAAYAFGHNMYCRFYQGTPLPELIQESQRSLDFSRTRVNQWAIDLLEGGLRIFGSLTDFAPSLDDDAAWETDYLRQVGEHHNIQVECIYQELRAFSLLMLGQFERALVWSDKVEPLIYTVGTQGLLPWPEHVFARALIISALYPDATPDRQATWRVELERKLEQLEIWADSCPENFAHKHALAAGEIARLNGQVFAAMRLYHQAAEAAATGGFTQWEGLANERAAELLETCGQGHMASVYWQQAYSCYYRWGATRKLQAMETACRNTLSIAIQGVAKSGAAENVLDQKLLSELVERQLHQLRAQSAEIDYSGLQNEYAHKSQELAEGAERLRVEVAERKRAEEQLQHHREHLAETIRQRTAELEASRDQLDEARAAALQLMEDAIVARDLSESGRVALEREVTERKKTEQALQTENEKNRALLHNGSDGIHITDTEGNIIEASDAFCDMLGYRRDEIIGLNVSRWDAKFTGNDLTEVVRQLFAKQARSQFETLHRRKNGTIFEVEVSSLPLELGGKLALFCSSRDITERKNLEKITHESETLLRQMFDTSPIAVRIKRESDHRIVFANQSYASLFHTTKEDVLGSDPIRFYRNRKDYQDISKRLSDGERILNNEVELLTIDGQRLWVLASYFPFEYEGEAAILGWFYEVTELKEARQAAELLARSKSEFLANMSHEIRTPMNGIIGLTQLALNQPTSPELRDYLEKISTSSQSLLGILNDILDFSKLDAGRMAVEHNPFDLDVVLDNLRNLFGERAHAQHLDFSIEVSDDTPRDLVGDAMRLQQILANLLGNALKFTLHGHVALNISATQRKGKKVKLRFAVEDTGIGISKGDQAKLFQPFSQADGSITRRFGGTGLGLAISHNLLMLMNGEIEVNSVPDHGATFTFEILLDVANAGSERTKRHRTAHEAGELTHELEEKGSQLHGARILVVEDSIINQQVVKEFLKLSGMEVAIANNGLEAIDLLSIQPFDAVLMDVHMPVMGGVEATRRIRTEGNNKILPIIALTAGVTQAERENCLACGMNDFIAKPVNPEHLITLLAKWVVPIKVTVSRNKKNSSSPKPTVLIMSEAPEELNEFARALKQDYLIKVATSGAKLLEIVSRGQKPDLLILGDISTSDGDVIRRLDANDGISNIRILQILAEDDSQGVDLSSLHGTINTISKPVSPELLKARVYELLEGTREHGHQQT